MREVGHEVNLLKLVLGPGMNLDKGLISGKCGKRVGRLEVIPPYLFKRATVDDETLKQMKRKFCKACANPAVDDILS